MFLCWTKCGLHPDDFWLCLALKWKTHFCTFFGGIWRRRRVLVGPLLTFLCCAWMINIRQDESSWTSKPLEGPWSSTLAPAPDQADLRGFGNMVRHFQQHVDFVVLYIEEVHPVDGWAFKVRQIPSFWGWTVITFKRACLK